MVTVAGIQQDGRFVLSFRSGPLTGQLGSGWNRSDIAVERGCSISRTFCVGSRAYHITRGASVTVVAIQIDGRMVLRFDNGPLTGQLGSGWNESDLAVTEGTYGPQPPAYGPQPPVYVPAPPPVPAQPPVVVVPGGGPALPGALMVCSTQSNGRHFSTPGRGFAEARAKAVFACSSSPYTNHLECERNLRCR